MTNTIPADSIVVAHDNSEHSAEALTWGLEQAELERRPVEVVHLLNVTEVQSAAWIGTSGAGMPVLEELRHQSVAALDELVARARRQHPDLQINSHVIERETRQGLVELSGSAHLLVLGSHGWGPVGSVLLGSVGAAVTRRTRCPAVVVRPPADDHPHHTGSAGVLVGVDGTPDSRPVIEYAFAQASLRGLPLTAVHCVRDLVEAYVGDTGIPRAREIDRAHDALGESLAALTEKHPEVAVTTRLEHGLVTQVAGNQPRLWDLVVVGRRRHGAWHRLLVGSTATTVLEHARCPVAVVPEERVPAERG